MSTDVAAAIASYVAFERSVVAAAQDPFYRRESFRRIVHCAYEPCLKFQAAFGT
jgi:hypothetical protein